MDEVHILGPITHCCLAGKLFWAGEHTCRQHPATIAGHSHPHSTDAFVSGYARLANICMRLVVLGAYLSGTRVAAEVMSSLLGH